MRPSKSILNKTASTKYGSVVDIPLTVPLPPLNCLSTSAYSAQYSGVNKPCARSLAKRRRGSVAGISFLYGVLRSGVVCVYASISRLRFLRASVRRSSNAAFRHLSEQYILFFCAALNSLPQYLQIFVYNTAFYFFRYALDQRPRVYKYFCLDLARQRLTF